MARRFQKLWEVEPWGLIKGALGVLERIWLGKRSRLMVEGEGTLLKEQKGDGDWIMELRRRGVDWLIL